MLSFTKEEPSEHNLIVKAQICCVGILRPFDTFQVISVAHS